MDLTFYGDYILFTTSIVLPIWTGMKIISEITPVVD